MSHVIGVFGLIGSGKSTVAKIINRKYGYYHLDIDAIGHQLFTDQSVKTELVKLFGLPIISKDGIIHRKKIAQVVFTNKVKKNELEQLLWPKMTYQIKEIVKQKNNVILDGALLFSAKWNILCHATIYIEASLEQMERHWQDRNRSKDEIRLILDSQEEIKKQKELATYQIQNNGSIQELTSGVEEIMKLIQERWSENK